MRNKIKKTRTQELLEDISERKERSGKRLSLAELWKELDEIGNSNTSYFGDQPID